jgi:hypothetical protein
VVQPKEKAAERLINAGSLNSEIVVTETSNSVKASVAGLEFIFSKENGTLLSAKNRKGNVSFHGGPAPAGVESDVSGTQWQKDNQGNFIFEISYSNTRERMFGNLKKVITRSGCQSVENAKI